MSESHQPKSAILLYQAEDGKLKVDVRLEGETAWLTQAQMAELFLNTVPNINIHLRNIFAEGELQGMATLKEFLIVGQERNRQVSRSVDPYSVDAIISAMRVGECQRAMDAARKKLSLAHRTHHDLRHLFATRCTVSRWPEHKDGGALAMKVYGHLRNQHSAIRARPTFV